MPLHPPPPSDAAGLLAAYDQGMQAFIDVASTLREDDWDRPTQCPGWTVQDVVAHVAGLEGWMAGDEIPQVEVPDLPHVVSDIDRFIESFVEVRRTRSGPEIVEELREILVRRQASLYGTVTDLETEILGTFGPAPAADALGMRILDTWTHEQDLRQAIGRPGNLETPAAAVTLARFERGLPKVIARGAGIEPGNAVVFEITGPLVGRMGVRVEAGESGKPRGIALFSGESSAADDDTTTISLSTDAFARRAAGRGELEDIHWTVTSGSEDIARRVLAALPQTP